MTDAMRKARALDAQNQKAAEILAAQDLPPGSLAQQWAVMVLNTAASSQADECQPSSSHSTP